MEITVAGAGIFGATAALSLVQRGHRVTLCDAGAPPHPDAASTDLSKLIRMDYGHDAWWLSWMREAMVGWDAWNERAERPLYHEDGVLMLAGGWAPGGFEHDSFHQLLAHDEAPEPLDDPAAIRARFDAWRAPGPGYRNPRAGWAESGAVVAQVIDWAREAGVTLRPDAPVRLDALPRADCLVIAAGAWTPTLLPELADRLRPVGQPVLHFAPSNPERWRGPEFPPWACDIASSGFYGFPATADGIVKIANHGAGVVTDPRGPRTVSPGWHARFRRFMEAHLPELAAAPLVGERLCLYCDSFDGAFLIDRHPARPELVVATGGSGHGFKFAPVLGDLIADVVEGRPHPRQEPFRWRALGTSRTEHARSAR